MVERISVSITDEEYQEMKIFLKGHNVSKIFRDTIKNEIDKIKQQKAEQYYQSLSGI